MVVRFFRPRLYASLLKIKQWRRVRMVDWELVSRKLCGSCSNYLLLMETQASLYSINRLLEALWPQADGYACCYKWSASSSQPEQTVSSLPIPCDRFHNCQSPT